MADEYDSMNFHEYNRMFKENEANINNKLGASDNI